MCGETGDRQGGRQGGRQGPPVPGAPPREVHAGGPHLQASSWGRAESGGGEGAPGAHAPLPGSDARLLPLFAGEIFLETAPDKFTLEEAAARCRALGAELASTGQLYAAWSVGLDACSPGWLADGSVRYPIVTPRERCGGALPGVKTIFLFRNQTGFPDAQSRYDAYCFRGKEGHSPGPRMLPGRDQREVLGSRRAGVWVPGGCRVPAPAHPCAERWVQQSWDVLQGRDRIGIPACSPCCAPRYRDRAEVFWTVSIVHINLPW